MVEGNSKLEDVNCESARSVSTMTTTTTARCKSEYKRKEVREKLSLRGARDVGP